MVKYIIIILLLIASQAMGADSVHTVNSLPASFTQADHSGSGVDTIKFSGDLVSTSDGLTFSDCNDWVVLFEGNTITFANDSDGAINYGIGFGSNDDSYDIVLLGDSTLKDTIYDTMIYQNDTTVDTIYRYIGGNIIQATPQTRDTNTYALNDLTDSNNVCIAMGFNTNNITMKYLYLEVNGYSCKGISLGGGGNFLMEHLNIRSNSPFFSTRATYEGAAIRGLKTWDSSLILDNTYSYHARCYDVKVERAPYSGIVMSQSSGWHRLEVEACTLNIDAWNIRYTGGEGAELGTANCYGIHTLRQGRGFIKDCKITSGIAHKGSRGIMLERPKGVVDTLIEIADNYLDNHEGVGVQFTAGYFPCNIKFRSQPRGVWLHGNTCIFTADGSVPNDSTEQNNNAYYWSGESITWEVNVFAAGWSPPYNFTVEDNIFKARDRATGAWLSAVTFGSWIDVNTYDSTTIWRNNWVESDSIGYQFGGFDGSAHFVKVVGDTLTLVDTASGHTAYFMGYGTYTPTACTSNIMQDMVYRFDSGGADTGQAVYLDTTVHFPNANLSDIALWLTCSVYVTDLIDSPVSGADVWVINDCTDTVISAQTNAAGIVTGVITNFYESRTATDSLLAGFAPYVLKAKKSSDSASSSLDLRWNLKKDTLQLAIGAPSNDLKFQGIKIKGVTIQ